MDHAPKPRGDDAQGMSSDLSPVPTPDGYPLLTASAIADLLDRGDLAPTKGLGQNFVADPNTIRKIVRLAGVGSGDRVVEVGPGLGSLTLGLVEAGVELTAIERDRYLVPVLRQTMPPAVRLIEADALELDWAETFGSAPLHLVANLPYNIAATLILHLLDHAPMVERMTVMVQREVGERLSAGPGSKVYGIPSVKLAMTATASVVAPISREVFVPKPRVDSAVISVRRLAEPVPTQVRALVGELLTVGFGQRRKMLRSTIGRSYGIELLERSGIDPQLRPEQLDVSSWTKMAERLATQH